MSRLPDRFDLAVRAARDEASSAEALAPEMAALLYGLPAWHFLNVGTAEAPVPHAVEHEGQLLLAIFSDADHADDFLKAAPRSGSVLALRLIGALAWCREWEGQGVTGLLVNPGAFAFAISFEALAEFEKERQARGEAGYWVAGTTSEEEDFWQEHGL